MHLHHSMLTVGLLACVFGQFCTAFLQVKIHRTSTSTAQRLHAASSTAAGLSTYWETATSAPEPFLSNIRSEPWRGALEPVVEQGELVEVKTEGKMPRGLVGTRLNNGPGRIRFGDAQYGHWFDGDGLVAKAVFTPQGKVLVQCRYVRTPVYEAQERTGDPFAMRRPWTQAGKGGFFSNVLKRPSNTANTNVFDLHGRILALQEGARPVELDPLTMETLESLDFQGKLTSTYSAHPSICPQTGEVFNHGIDDSSPFLFKIMRFSPEGELVVEKPVEVTDGMTFIHDNTISSKYFSFFVTPWKATKAEAGQGLLGLKPFAFTMGWKPEEGTQVYFYNRDTLEMAGRVVMPPRSHFHLVNAFETSSGSTVIIGARLRGDKEEQEEAFADLYRKRLRQDLECDLIRYEFDVEKGELISETNLSEGSGAQGFELPAMDDRFISKPSRYVYTNSLLGDAGFLNGIQVVDMETKKWSTYNPGPGRYAGTVTFVPSSANAKEGEGWLLFYVYETSTHTSTLEVLDAQKVEKGPVFSAKLPFHMPFFFHGTWTDRILA